MLIPNNVDISELFPEPDKEESFTDAISGQIYPLRNTVAREKRIVGLGPYYRDYELNAGDEIVFERRMLNGVEKYYIHALKHNDILVFQKYKSGFEILTPERIDLFNSFQNNGKLSLSFIKSDKKRTDSPLSTNYFDIKLEGNSLMSKYSTKEYGYIIQKGDGIREYPFCAWKKVSYEWSDYE